MWLQCSFRFELKRSVFCNTMIIILTYFFSFLLGTTFSGNTFSSNVAFSHSIEHTFYLYLWYFKKIIFFYSPYFFWEKTAIKLSKIYEICCKRDFHRIEFSYLELKIIDRFVKLYTHLLCPRTMNEQPSAITFLFIKNNFCFWRMYH